MMKDAETVAYKVANQTMNINRNFLPMTECQPWYISPVINIPAARPPKKLFPAPVSMSAIWYHKKNVLWKINLSHRRFCRHLAQSNMPEPIFLLSFHFSCMSQVHHIWWLPSPLYFVQRRFPETYQSPVQSIPLTAEVGVIKAIRLPQRSG